MPMLHKRDIQTPCPYCGQELYGHRLKVTSVVYISQYDELSGESLVSDPRTWACPHCENILYLSNGKLKKVFDRSADSGASE